MKFGIIDYGAGNLQSVRNAAEYLNWDSTIITHGAHWHDEVIHAGVDVVLLPGVGSFGDAVKELQQRQLFSHLQDWLKAGKPFLGICLGYQLLFEESEETPGVPGLGHYQGKVVRFPQPKDPSVKIPHMGWNSLAPTVPNDPVWKGLGNDPYVYYVHSYYPSPEDSGLVTAYTQHGDSRFAAGVRAKNLLAVQFHPEKSQETGLQLMRNFADSLESSPI